MGVCKMYIKWERNGNGGVISHILFRNNSYCAHWCCIQDCDTVYFVMWLPIFWGNMLTESAWQKTGHVGLSSHVANLYTSVAYWIFNAVFSGYVTRSLKHWCFTGDISELCDLIGYKYTQTGVHGIRVG